MGEWRTFDLKKTNVLCYVPSMEPFVHFERPCENQGTETSGALYRLIFLLLQF